MKKAVNNFLKGIIADRTELDADPRSVTDAVNATVLSRKGNQLVTSTMKSNSPVEALEAISAKLMEVPGKGYTVNLNDYYNVITLTWKYDKKPNIQDFKLIITYEDGTESILWDSKEDLNRLPNLDYSYKLSLNPDKRIIKVNCPQITMDTVDKNSTMCTLDLGQLKTSYTGIPKENKILGVKTFNDIAYIVSGRQVDKQYTNSKKQHSQDTLSDLYRLDSLDSNNSALPEFNGHTKVQASVEYPILPQTEVIRSTGGYIWFWELGLSYYDENRYRKIKVEKRVELEGNHTFTLNVDYEIGSFNDGHYDLAVFLLKNGEVIRKWPKNSEYSVAIEDSEGKAIPSATEMFHSEHVISKQFEFTEYVTPDDEFEIEFFMHCYDSGEFKFKCDATMLAEPPTIIDEGEEKIEDFSLAADIWSASNNLSSDGGFSFNAPVAGEPYKVYIDNGDPIEVEKDQPFSTADIGQLYNGSGFRLSKGLPPGEYLVTVAYIDTAFFGLVDTHQYVRSEVVTIGSEDYIDSLKLNSEIYEFRGLGDPFKLKLKVDDYNPHSNIEYRFYYQYSYKDNENNSITIPRVYSNYSKSSSHEFTISAIDQPVSLMIGVEEKENHPKIVADDYYKTSKLRRICQDSVGIQEDLVNNKYAIEIGTFPSPSYKGITGSLVNVYRPLQNYKGRDFITDKIFLSGKSYLDMEIQAAYDNTVNIIFTEPNQIARQVNSGFSVLSDSKYELKNISAEDVGIYKAYNEQNIDTRTKLIQSTKYIPDFDVGKINASGGILEVGSYQYYIRYSTYSGNETGILAESGLIPIFKGNSLATISGGKAGSTTSKSIEFKVKNVDPSFDYVTLYYVLNTGDDVLETRAFKVHQKYLIPKDSIDGKCEMTIVHSGYEKLEQIPEDSLSELREYYRSIKTLAQVQNRLMIADLKSFSINYDKLFKIGKKICVVPSSKTPNLTVNKLYSKWRKEEGFELDFDDFAYAFCNEDILYDASVGDINKKLSASDKKNLNTILQSQGTYNPLFSSKFAGYWPLEVYKFGVSFVLEGDQVTRPIPIVGADFSTYHQYANEENINGNPANAGAFSTPMYTTEEELNSELQATVKKMKEGAQNNKAGWFTMHDEGADPTWFENGGMISKDKVLHGNNLGYIRFPNRKYPNQPLFPKFIFDLEELKQEYPEFFNRVKGIFFTRTERNETILMEGFTLPTKLVPTLPTAVQSVTPDLYGLNDPSLTELEAGGEEYYSSVPYISEKRGEDIYRYMIMGHSENAETAYLSYIGTMVHPYALDTTFLDNSIIQDGFGSGVNDHFGFYSGDLVPYKSKAAASFNGQSYSILSSSWSKTKIKHWQGSNILEGRTQMYGTILGSDDSSPNRNPKPLRITAEYIDYGKKVKSGSGFASKIPYLAGRAIMELGGVQRALFPTGNYEPYIGFTGKMTDYDLSMQPVLLFANATGPLTVKQLQTIYNTDVLTDFKSVTPVYPLEDVEQYMKSGILGNRGDCFTNFTWLNIAKTLPSVGPNPTSRLYDVKHNGEEGLMNLYNRGEASLNLAMTHASNFLNFAKHDEVVDEVESALYGRARSFLPKINSFESRLHLDRNSKLPATSAFNQGYSAPFTGRKIYNVLSTADFATSLGSNTVAFSEKLFPGSTYNSYRDFFASSNKDYNKELGGITKILNYNNNLLLIHSKGISLVGVNDQTVIGKNSGGKVYTDSSEVLNPKSNVISHKYGTKWMRSVCTSDNAVYGVDVDNFKIWGIRGNNLKIISDGKINRILAGVLHEFKGASEIPGERYIASHYDSTKGDVIFTIYNKNSVYTEFPLPMDVDEFYMIEDMREEDRKPWVEEPLNKLDSKDNSDNIVIEVKTEVLRRKRIFDQYQNIKKNYKTTNHVTLVYNEASNTWVTRLSHSPEFAFNLNNSFYSINNEEYSKQFPSFLSHKDGHKLIWDHLKASKDIEVYGSMYGSKPIFELEFVVNDFPAYKKLFKLFTILGNEAKPSEVIYGLPPSSPWLNVLQHTRYHTDTKYLTWKTIEEQYLDKLTKDKPDYPIVNPFTLVKQEILDRRVNPIFKSNYQFTKTNNVISIGKNLTPLFWTAGNKDLTTNFSDKWLKIRLRYTSGEYVYIKEIYTEYNPIY